MPDDPDDKDAIIATLRKEDGASRRRIRDLEAHNTQLAAQLADQDKVIAIAKGEGAAEERARLEGKYTADLADARILAAAKGVWAHPEDALVFVDKAKVIVDGKISDEAITAELAAKLETRPEYKANGAPPAPGAGTGRGDGDGGARGVGGRGDGDGGARRAPVGDTDAYANALIRGKLSSG